MLSGVYIPRMDHPRCFVAIRYGEPQTDKVYERLIEPTLKQEALIPIRIDRVEHNDNIDARIILEIEGCDLALADLTFARPSVYFEAGYAERRIPVIYICRKDHFTPKPEDKYENFRVHFDLQMKNIIPWRNDSDLLFAKRLKAQIRKVVRPILMKQAKRVQENESHLRFSQLPMARRMEAVYSILRRQLKPAGFSQCDEDEHIFFSPRKPSRKRTIVICGAGETISKTDLQGGFNAIRRDLVHLIENIAKQRGAVKPNRLVVHWIVCTLNRNPPSRVHSAFQYFAQDRLDSSKYLWQFDQVIMVPVPVKFYLHTIDNIKSEDDFSKKLKATLSAL